jgi:hypothetical protein
LPNRRKFILDDGWSVATASGQGYAWLTLTERPVFPTLLPFELGAAAGSLGSNRTLAAKLANGCRH